MRQVTDAERQVLRAAYAAVLVVFSRERTRIGPELQRLLKQSWDIVRNADDPALAFEAQASSRLVLPFGPGIQ